MRLDKLRCSIVGACPVGDGCRKPRPIFDGSWPCGLPSSALRAPLAIAGTISNRLHESGGRLLDKSFVLRRETVSLNDHAVICYAIDQSAHGACTEISGIQPGRGPESAISQRRERRVQPSEGVEIM